MRYKVTINLKIGFLPVEFVLSGHFSTESQTRAIHTNNTGKDKKEAKKQTPSPRMMFMHIREGKKNGKKLSGAFGILRGFHSPKHETTILNLDWEFHTWVNYNITYSILKDIYSVFCFPGWNSFT